MAEDQPDWVPDEDYQSPLLLQARPELGESYIKQAGRAFLQFARSRESEYSNNAGTQLERDFRRFVSRIRTTLPLNSLQSEVLSARSDLDMKQGRDELEEQEEWGQFLEEIDLLVGAMVVEWRRRFGRINQQTSRLVVIAFNAEFNSSVSPFADRLQQAVEERTRQLADRVTLTNKRAVLEEVRRGILNGESMDGIQQRVRNIVRQGLYRTTDDGRVFRVLSRDQRVQMIARTESRAMTNSASLQAGIESEAVNRKVWQTMGDDRVRPSHVSEAGPPGGIPLDEAFPVTGMMYPHAVNERCWLSYLNVDESEETE